jgi:hypothetical protein
MKRKREGFNTEGAEVGAQSSQRRDLGRSLVAVVPPLRGPTRQTSARNKKSGRSGRDDG